MHDFNNIKAAPVPSLAETLDICRDYDIGSLITLEDKIMSTTNINIRIVTSKGRYVIKIFSSTPTRFNFIITVLEKLNTSSFPVLLPIKNKNGLSYSLYGSKLLQVTKFINGYPFISDRRQAWSSGLTLRRFHNILSETYDVINPKASLYPYSDRLKKGIHALEEIENEFPKEQLHTLNSLYSKIIDKWETKSNGIPKTIIHGDWHQGNQLYDKMGKVCCVMDFDYMTRAERIFDVAYALWRFRDRNEPIRIAKAFMEGYGCLTKEEIYLLPLEMARINFFFICASGLSSDPKYEFRNQYSQQIPFIIWALSKEGEITINRLCKK